jgi:hypothetical protein
VLGFGILLFLLAVHPTKAQHKFEWWTDASQNTRTPSELEEVLRKHLQWIESEKKSGSRADLTGAYLRYVNLAGANLEEAVLSRAIVEEGELTGANLLHADLSRANLTRANLSRGSLRGANMNRAYSYGANLTGADLAAANLRGADLTRANLTGADLVLADLTEADLGSADLTSAKLDAADLARVIFEPKSLPELRGIAAARNLELLTYKDNPDALAQLRKQFQDGGFREQERKITYALKRREADLANYSSFIFGRVFFDWTCQYGMSPGRPLILGVLLWILCSLLYFACLHTSGETGLYRVYSQSIQEDPSVHRRVERISPPGGRQTRGTRRFLQFFWREWLLLRASMFFSLMSAFNIGFRDINFGRWLRLLTRQEFDIKVVGWARVVAGWQSLISVYLIALWVLTYFGRPFD